MSITIMAMIFAANLEPIKKLVLLSLADHGSDEGLSIYPSIMTTSKRTGLSESTIRKTQSELEKSGILKKISTGGGRNTNHYKIDINKIAEVTPPTDGGHPSDRRRAPLRQTEGTPPTYTPESLVNHKLNINESIAPSANVKTKPSSKKKSNTVPKEIITPIVDAIASVTGKDKTLNYPRLATEAKGLHLAGYNAEQILSIYSRGGAWYKLDWRGKKGQVPAIGNIKESIKQLLNGNKPADGKRKRTDKEIVDDHNKWCDENGCPEQKVEYKISK